MSAQCRCQSEPQSTGIVQLPHNRGCPEYRPFDEIEALETLLKSKIQIIEALENMIGLAASNKDTTQQKQAAKKSVTSKRHHRLKGPDGKFISSKKKAPEVEIVPEAEVPTTAQVFLDALFQVQDQAPPAVPAKIQKAKEPKPTSLIWEAYREAYLNRYKVEPVRNATINAQIAQLHKRLGEEAIDVVRFYLQHNKSYYVQQCHSIGVCLRECEGLRTQWARGKAVTTTEARLLDQTQNNMDSWTAALNEWGSKGDKGTEG